MPPKQRRRTLRIIALATCALFVLALLTPYALSLGYLRSLVQTEVSNHLLGECEIDAVSFSWFSGVSASGLRIDNPPGFTNDRDAVVMQSLNADVSLWSLLSGRTLAAAEIVGLTVNVEQRADGTTNLHELVPVAPDSELGKPDEPAADRPGAGPATEEAGDLGFNVKLRDCAIFIRREGELLESLTDFACEAHSDTDSTDIDIDANGKLQAGDIAVMAHIRPSRKTTDAQVVAHGLNLHNWRPIIDAFKPGQIKALAGEANGDITATIHDDESIEIRGEMTIDGPRVAGPIVQDMDLRAKQWKITPELNLGGSNPADLDASKFAIDLEWLHIKGLPATRPGHVTLEYDLDVSRLAEFGGPLPALLKGTGSLLDGVLTMPSSELPADATGWLQALVTNADLKVRSIDLAGFQLSDLGLNISLEDSALTVTTSESTKLDGGALQAGIKIDLKSLDEMPTRASLKWSGGKLTGGATETLRYVVPLFAGLDADAAQIIGDVNLDVDITGPAWIREDQSVMQWLDTWSGEGSVGLANTAFAPSKQLQGLLSPLGSLAKTSMGDNGQLKIDGFSAPFQFAKGVVSNKSAEWSSAGNTIGLTGNTGFDGAINYALDFSSLLKSHKDGQKVLRALKGKVPPANLKGSLDSPKLSLPKLGDLANKLVEQQGKDLLQKGLNSLFKKRK